jgi:hypothetical protein
MIRRGAGDGAVVDLLEQSAHADLDGVLANDATGREVRGPRETW